jgi:uncharacterized protein YggE
MKKLTFLLLLLSLVYCTSLYSQISGNQVYQNTNNSSGSYSPVKKRNIVSTDSTLVITARVLLNKKADYYLVTVGVKETAKTVLECNQQINNRISSLLSDLEQIGIGSAEVYTDFITQTKVYDHTIDQNKITEFLDGFEIRKNLIIKVESLDLMDQLIELSAKQEVYDVVKVEYFNDDIEQIYDQLFDEVMKVVKKKKDRFAKYSSVKVSNRYRLINDNFTTFHPKDSYRQYKEAFETSTVNTHYSKNYIKKEVRKDRTFYYDGVQNQLGLDKVVDTISPVIGIQYTLELSVLYELDEE